MIVESGIAIGVFLAVWLSMETARKRKHEKFERLRRLEQRADRLRSEAETRRDKKQVAQVVQATAQSPSMARPPEDISSFIADAEAGDVASQLTLATMYLYGYGHTLPADPEQGIRWFERAAALGNAEAEFQLGKIWLSGRFVEPDSDRAFEYFAKAAEKQHAEACFALGKAAVEGALPESDGARAKEWLRMAAESGHGEAQYLLAYILRHEELTPESTAEMVQWYRKAAQNGQWEASLALAELYFNGIGMERDAVMAYTLLDKEQLREREEICLFREEIYHAMTDSERRKLEDIQTPASLAA